MAMIKFLAVSLAVFASLVLAQDDQCQCPDFSKKRTQPVPEQEWESPNTEYPVDENGVAVGGADISDIREKDEYIASLQQQLSDSERERNNYNAWYNAIRLYVFPALLLLLVHNV